MTTQAQIEEVRRRHNAVEELSDSSLFYNSTGMGRDHQSLLGQAHTALDERKLDREELAKLMQSAWIRGQTAEGRGWLAAADAIIKKVEG